MKTAILVDGGFYRCQSYRLFGEKNPEDRADELFRYCKKHLSTKYANYDLYRIFYYDCPPLNKQVYNPITKKSVDLSKSELYLWMTEFLTKLKGKRKLALRLGRISDTKVIYTLPDDTVKKLLTRTISIDDITENDLKLNVRQKGVDMKIGVDIASMAFKRQVDQIVLIAGDSDFVPAAKLARREGIDFILDPMSNHVSDDLFEHIDGIHTHYKKFTNTTDQQSCDVSQRRTVGD